MDVLSSLWALIREPFFKYAVVASFGYTVVEYLDEYLLDGTKTETSNGVGLLTLVSGFFGAVIAATIYLFTLATGEEDQLLIGSEYAVQAGLSGALEVIWMIPYLHATNRSGTMQAAPLFQTIPVFSFVLGYFFFGENLGLEHVIGSFVIVSGAFLLNLNRETLELDRKTVLLMFLTSFIIALVYSIFKDVAVESNFTASLFWSGIGMTLMSTVIWCVYKPYRDEFNEFICSPCKKLVLLQLLNEGVNAASVSASHFVATTAPSVMVATALNAFHPVFILLGGWLMGKAGSDKHTKALVKREGLKKALAILLIVAGTILIAL